MSISNFNIDDLNDFDEESKKMLLGLQSSKSFLNFDNIENSNNDPNHPLNQIRIKDSFKERSNEIALGSPLGKESIFYVPQKGTLRAFLTDKHLYEQAKYKFKDIDLESIDINNGISSKVPAKLKKM